MGLFATILASITTLVICAPCYACSCGGTAKPDASFRYSDAVFAGTVVGVDSSRIESPDQFYLPFLFNVTHVWKGEARDSIVVETARYTSMCGIAFKTGVSYLVYARDYRGGLKAHGCGRTRQLEDAIWDRYWLSAPEFVRNGSRTDIPTLDDLFHMLDEDNSYLNSQASRALGYDRDNRDVIIQRLVQRLRAGDSRNSAQAASTLGLMQRGARPAADDLVRALREGDRKVRRSALFALAGALDSGAFYPYLLVGLKDRDPLVRKGAIWLIYRGLEWRTSREKRYLLSRMITLSRDLSPSVRRAALQRYHLFPEAYERLAVLAEGLAGFDGDAAVRKEARSVSMRLRDSIRTRED